MVQFRGRGYSWCRRPNIESHPAQQGTPTLTNSPSPNRRLASFFARQASSVGFGLPPNNPVMAHKTAHPSVQRLRPRCIAKVSTNCAKCFQSASEIRFSIDNKGPDNGLQDKGPDLTLP